MCQSYLPRGVTASILILLSAASSFAFQPPQEAEPKAGVRVTSEAVLLDVVIRDKGGKPVRDLGIDEIEVFENGQKQEILWFSPVREDSEAPPADLRTRPLPSVGYAADKQYLTNLVSLVFDNMSPDASNMARIAAMDFAEKFAAPDLYIAVFNCERRLIALSPFTNKLSALRQAINEATSQTPLKYYQKSQEIFERASEQSLGQEQLPEGIREPQTSEQGAVPQDIESMMATVIATNLRFSAQVDRELGSRSIYSLLALLQGMGSLQGRKTIIYFSEGVFLSSNYDKLFQTLIGDANRKNVSFYCVDARGLSSSSQLAAAAVALRAAASTSMAQQTKPAGEAVTSAEVGLPDSAHSIQRLNLQAVLQNLAESTGGRLIAETNDFREGLRKVGEDIESYYEVVYSPKELQYDGRFRAIEVRVTRPGARVQSRTGYYAFPPRGDLALLPSEVDLLEVLHSGSAANPLDLQIGLLRFAPGLAGYRHEFFLRIPFEKLHRVPEQGDPGLEYMVLVNDERGDLVAKASGSRQLTTNGGQEPSLEGRTLDIIEKAILGPGRYTIRAAVRSRNPAVLSVATLPEVDVPVLAKGVSVSDLVIVKYAEDAGAQVDQPTPLHYQNFRLVPNFSRLLDTHDQQLALFFRIYPRDGAIESLQGRLDFLQAGKLIGSNELEIPGVQPDGSIPVLSIFPMTAFPPGTYALRLRVDSDLSSAKETTAFSVMQ